MSDAPSSPLMPGFHHVTCISGDPARTARFYRDVLGLRLVKRTVNFDDPGSYHLYFGDEGGRPGTLITFFEWPGARRGHPGVGATHHIAFAVPNTETQLMWKRWLTDRGLKVEGPYDRVYFTSIYFTDPDGLNLELATRGPGFALDEPADALGRTMIAPPQELMIGHRDEAAIAARTWPQPVPALTPEMRISGIHHITGMVSDIEATSRFYTDVLGLPLVKKTLNFDNPSAPHYYWGAEGGRPGSIMTAFGYPPGTMPRGRVGAGMTHHIAFLARDRAEQDAWSARLRAAGFETSERKDRRYFESIYFRDPDGHLLEIATAGPGFAVDEAPAHLGERLSLPPWLEPERATIAVRLRELH